MSKSRKIFLMPPPIDQILNPLVQTIPLEKHTVFSHKANRQLCFNAELMYLQKKSQTTDIKNQTERFITVIK